MSLENVLRKILKLQHLSILKLHLQNHLKFVDQVLSWKNEFFPLFHHNNRYELEIYKGQPLINEFITLIIETHVMVCKLWTSINGLTLAPNLPYMVIDTSRERCTILLFSQSCMQNNITLPTKT